MVSEKKILLNSFSITSVSIGANDPRGHGQFEPQGHDWQDSLNFFHYKSLGVNDPRGMASLDPRSLTGRIYVADY